MGLEGGCQGFTTKSNLFHSPELLGMPEFLTEFKRGIRKWSSNWNCFANELGVNPAVPVPVLSSAKPYFFRVVGCDVGRNSSGWDSRHVVEALSQLLSRFKCNWLKIDEDAVADFCSAELFLRTPICAALKSIWMGLIQLEIQALWTTTTKKEIIGVWLCKLSCSLKTGAGELGTKA